MTIQAVNRARHRSPHRGLPHHLPRRRQIGLRIGQSRPRTRHLVRRITIARVLVQGVQVDFRCSQPLPRRGHLAGRSRAGRVEPGQRRQILARLITFQPGARHVGRRRLTLLLGSIVNRRLQGRLCSLYAAFGRGLAGERLHAVQRHQQLACRYLIARLRIYRFDSGRHRAVNLEVHHRLHAAIGADRAQQRRALRLRGMNQQPVAGQGAHEEEHGNRQQESAQPKPAPVKMLSFLGHSGNQSQYIGRGDRLRKRSKPKRGEI